MPKSGEKERLKRMMRTHILDYDNPSGKWQQQEVVGYHQVLLTVKRTILFFFLVFIII